MNAKELNRYVGNCLAKKRKEAGRSLVEIANLIGVSFQQVQKYEAGHSEISSARLYQIATLFNVDYDAFFKGFKTFTKRLSSTPGTIIQQDRVTPLNVVLVDDDATYVHLTRKAFETYPLSVNLHTVHEGADVRSFLRNAATIAPFSRPDIIILALNLPTIDGISIVREIKQDDALSDIPVIILATRACTHGDMLTCYQEQVSGFISKAVDFDVFEKSIALLAQYWGQTVVLPNRQYDVVYNASHKKHA